MEAKRFVFCDPEKGTELDSIIQDSLIRAVEDKAKTLDYWDVHIYVHKDKLPEGCVAKVTFINGQDDDVDEFLVKEEKLVSAAKAVPLEKFEDPHPKEQKLHPEEDEEEEN